MPRPMLAVSRLGRPWCRCTNRPQIRMERAARQRFPSQIIPMRRYVSSLEAGESKTGHIFTKPGEGIIFFSNMFPLRLKWLSRLPWQTEQSIADVLERLSYNNTRADPRNIISTSKAPVDVIEVLPRLKEGGAFVKFTWAGEISAEQIETMLAEHLKVEKIKQWWTPFDRMRAGLVRGKPWVEDLYRLPSKRVKVEFLPSSPGEEATELSQEQLYSFFRPYGKLVDIISQPTDSKVLPRYALIDFSGLQRAIMAKNCLHGLAIPEQDGGGKAGTLFRISYERKLRTNWILDWISNHTRIVIPVVAALVAAVTVAIFDPIRTWFIKVHITRQFSLANYSFYRWFKAQATDLFNVKRHDPGMTFIWNDRKENIEQIRGWLLESSDTFNIVQGPRGSGKRELVDEGLKHQKYKLTIDCKPIQEARGDSATISAAASQVGYRPVFSFMNSISGWIDLAAQGTTGVKTGFSETLETQLIKIWNNTATALKQIALEGRKKDDKDSHLADDEYLEAHPERRPVIVIDNFLHKSQENPFVYDRIAEWAARITTANIGHVIFLTNDVSFSKSLTKALPDRVFRQISLTDASPSAAKEFIMSHLDSEEGNVDASKHPSRPGITSQQHGDLEQLDECIDSLGGRLTDLEFLARRIKSGESPKKAVREIVEQSSSEILKMYLIGQEDNTRTWTPEQAWYVIKSLAASHSASLRYNETVLSAIFKGDGDQVLQALEQAELISIIVSSNGRPESIRSGKPVFLPAFRRLTEDPVLRSRLDLRILGELTKDESAAINKCEIELDLLGRLPKQPVEIGSRVKWLLAKLATSHTNIENYEAESKVLKGILNETY